MFRERRRDIAIGGAAGLIGGLAMSLSAAASDVNGLLDVEISAATMAVQLALAGGLGLVFGSLFRYQPRSYTALISNGLLFSLLLWILGPLTLSPILGGDGPNWSVVEASDAFATLVAHLLYGSLTGLGYFLIFSRYGRDLSEPAAEIQAREPNRVVILGGGFGGIGTATQLEHMFRADPDLEISLVSQSNYLLFTPMLAEVAASALEPQHISSPVRASLPHTRFYPAQVESVDTDGQVVSVRYAGIAATEQLPIRPSGPMSWFCAQLLRPPRYGGALLLLEDPRRRDAFAKPHHRAARARRREP